jgi:hypothetical protein
MNKNICIFCTYQMPSDKISILLFQCKECNVIIEQQLNSQNIITYHELNSNHFKIVYQAFLL